MHAATSFYTCGASYSNGSGLEKKERLRGDQNCNKFQKSSSHAVMSLLTGSGSTVHIGAFRDLISIFVQVHPSTEAEGGSPDQAEGSSSHPPVCFCTRQADRCQSR